jgi:endonuclease YncB( thermonuclease family)
MVERARAPTEVGVAVRPRLTRFALYASLSLLAVTLPAVCCSRALSGTVTEVPRAGVAVLNVGATRYIVRISGIEVPVDAAIAGQARQYIGDLMLGRSATLRFVSRAPNGELSGRLLVADPVVGIKDIGVELVRRGLARRQPGGETRYGYKYGELSAAEREAQINHRGLWANVGSR